MKKMNPQKHVTGQDLAEIKNRKWDGVSKPPQSLLNAWYKHESNRERTIADQERHYETSNNPFN